MGNVIKQKSRCREVVNLEKTIENKATMKKFLIQCPITSLPERHCARHGKPERLYKTTNPYLIFFLRLKSRKPHIPVVKMARVAGERWQCMTCQQRKKYIDLAEAEKKRRQGRRSTRRARRNWSKRACTRKKGSKRRG
ncbi:uncharacterized protein LOC131674256 [Phymastichus coffea]|uniref:uncharacterized protein LOC131674256 n=1 Tax=Phymastichus coffea TaxID=108790 RepID=UPI00273BC6A1|nr:uncharacterized protein LOC131674256 [Phymastichus coffea]